MAIASEPRHEETPAAAAFDLALHGGDEFVSRHIGPDHAEREAMRAELGVGDASLLDVVVPASIRSSEPLALPAGVPEHEVLARLRGFAAENQVTTSLIGLGYYGTRTPLPVLRNVLENPAWYTAYTPYQPEISQGRLEALLNFQTMVADLTGMDLANASLLDEGTAAAEAMTMVHRVLKHPGHVFVVDAGCFPQTIDVVRTRAEPLGFEVRVGDPDVLLGAAAEGEVFGVLLQYPGADGQVRDLTTTIERVQAAGGMAVVAADLLALALLRPPGEQGADVVVGSSQRFGVPMYFGGPHAAYLACRAAHQRSLPGRLVGVSVDDRGRTAFRLTLQTREQHIRREKATSNICTAQVLLAVVAGLYGTYHGADGLRRIAGRVHRLTSLLVDGLRRNGVGVENDTWFDTVVVRVPGGARAVLAAAAAVGIDLRLVDDDRIGISFDETTEPSVVEAVWAAFGVDAPLLTTGLTGIPDDLVRTSDFLTHPTFQRYRTETELMRYLRRLADKDLALDRTMIPLGSCTMKLNAVAELAAITWPEFADLHPFGPAERSAGTRRLIAELEAMLVEVTGYDAVSLQPNAGSQGEYAGLLAIRSWQRARGESHRDVCLIPSSAHGTNAASAAMAGLKVVVIPCDERGDVDVDGLRSALAQHGDQLAALMVTYPSTHGVFEERIVEICELVHEHGGQVYLDGANLNALVGVARPGRFGADVSHLNLHKTFTIPHGGGGPGVGPVGVRAHLAPFLPGSTVVPGAGPLGGPVVAAAPWGSAGILSIAWAYIALMGAEGLRQATEVAILNANYVAKRLAPHYPVLYTGPGGYVAHECIIDLRPLQQSCGLTVDDVAKRLIDYGFHAPTMSFPVAGTLMIEPTESETRDELDRFCDAMIAIRAEVSRVEAGEWPIEDSPLRHAPHTADDVAADVWERPYAREVGAWPIPSLRHDKYWPPVGRIDGAYGDRHVQCSCPPLSDWV